jgi:hypothetical protein
VNAASAGSTVPAHARRPPPHVMRGTLPRTPKPMRAESLGAFVNRRIKPYYACLRVAT